MFTSLTIVIGLIFVLLLFSLLTSAIMEVVASIFSLRAKNLRYTLDNMLGEKVDDFMRHPLFRQLAFTTNRKRRLSALSLPSYVSKETFLSILMDVLGESDREAMEQKITNLDEGDLKRMMLFLHRQSDGDPNKFKKKAGFWFDEVMNRSSEWYTRRLKYILFGVGLVLAFIFNVDALQIYQNISSSATIQNHLLEMASTYVEQPQDTSTNTAPLELKESMAQLNSAWEQFEYNTSPLGIGWNAIEEDLGFPGWLIKLAGFLVSAIAVTLGAPFWFDLLKKLLNIRGGTKIIERESEEGQNGNSASTTTNTKTEPIVTPNPPKEAPPSIPDDAPVG